MGELRRGGVRQEYSGNLERQKLWMEDLLREGMKPGTVLEVRVVSSLLWVWDIPFIGCLRSEIEKEEVPPESWRERAKEKSEGGGRFFKEDRQDPNQREVSRKLREEGLMQRVGLEEEIIFYDLPKVLRGKEEILFLPPDDWVMEMKVRGIPFLIIYQPDEEYVSIDMRDTAYEVRQKFREGFVKRLAKEEVKEVPKVRGGFPSVFKLWREEFSDTASGVILKKKSSVFPRGKGTRLWVKRRFWKER